MNIKVGDTVKVTGKTLVGFGIERELIKIGTICEVLDISCIDEDTIVELVPINKKTFIDDGWWYSIKDVEKGHLKWIPDKE